MVAWLCDDCFRDISATGAARAAQGALQRVQEGRRRQSDPTQLTVGEGRPARRDKTEGSPVGRRGARRTTGNDGGPLPVIVTKVVEPRLTAEKLTALHLLTSVKGLGPVAALEVFRHAIDPETILAHPERYPLSGKRASDVIVRIRAITQADRDEARAFAEKQVKRARELGVLIMTYDHPHYPPLVKESNNPQPMLWVRGNSEILKSREAVACVGSRGLRPPYADLHEGFAAAAVGHGFTVASGFALGADTAGHKAAFEKGGQTICVMPCGVDLVFPPENRPLWAELLRSDRAVFISEFPLGRRAESLTLRKRNKLIVAASRGVLASQTAANGGAMNAFRFAIEQKKQVATFEADGTEDTTGNEEIGRATKVRATTFPRNGSDLSDRYARWLCGL
ncbi:MAG: DNA-processing protein DprA [Pseudomonadota bacterium]